MYIIPSFRILCFLSFELRGTSELNEINNFERAIICD